MTDCEAAASANIELEIKQLEATSMKKRKFTESLLLAREIFPLKLHQLLNSEENEDIVKWMGNGEFFKVFDKKRFLVDVIPKYFRRKLLLYFSNVTFCLLFF